MLRGTNIHKSYQGLEVLKGVNIEIPEKTIATVIGASGAGKSTLLHILGTLDNADKGDVFLGEQNISSLKGKAIATYRNKYLGFIFQFHNLLPEFSALENIQIPALIGNKPLKESEERATYLLELLGLQDRMKNHPSQLSGGEQQRVSVARALMNEPKIIFADEPSGNLDSKNAQELHELFFELKEELNQTFVIVTHNTELAKMSDLVFKMKDGFLIDNE
tara:strand:- start:3771 stop:4430 length:660 start_codon:yes stop_codon:yes gene_type:complete